MIEVMVAMAIATLGLTAVIFSISQMIDTGNSMRQKTYASWIAQNKITEFRLRNIKPTVSETVGEVDYADREWSWHATISETGIDELYRVDVRVGLIGDNEKIRTVSGFIGEPGALGQSNLIWAKNSLVIDKPK